MMPTRFAIPLFSALLCFLAVPDPLHAQLSKHIADYTITARLNGAARSVEGEEIITWLNDSQDEIREIYFHLYMNAYRNSKSTFMLEADKPITPENAGGIDIHSLRIPGGMDLLPASSFVHPDDDNTDDMTVLRVPLPRALKPSESIQLNLTFTTTLPLAIGRSNSAEGCDYYFVAQWFPKIAVYRPSHGWNAHQFHRNTEFFADFGEYRVTLTVPGGYIVGATGVRTSSKDNGDGTVTVTYHQADVHDFAWTASPRFLEFHRVFNHPTLPPTQIILLLQPEHRDVRDRYLDAVNNTLKYFGEWYGEYPYSTITIVDPPRTSRSGGMEYPTLITGAHGGSLRKLFWILKMSRFTNSVISIGTAWLQATNLKIRGWTRDSRRIRKQESWKKYTGIQYTPSALPGESRSMVFRSSASTVLFSLQSWIRSGYTISMMDGSGFCRI
jgi:hypothetical protein